MGWETSEYPPQTTPEATAEYLNAQDALDVVLTDHRALAVNAAELTDALTWVYFTPPPAVEAYDHCLVIAADFTDEEFTRTVTVALNLARFEDQFASIDSKDPITRLPHHPDLLTNLDTKTGQPTGLLIVQLDHAQHLYANLDPVSRTDLLTALSQHLQTSLPERASVGMFDAGCFAVWVSPATPAQLPALAQGIQSKSNEPITFSSGQLHFTLSIGYAFDPNLTDPKSLWQQAWQAKETAEQQGGQRICGNAERSILVERVPSALERDEFSVALQPQINLSSGTLRGIEALLRWQGLDVGQLNPDHFIPLVERSGHMSRVGDWVLENTCSASSRWVQTLGQPMTIAVNTSPQQFRKDAIVEQIQRLVNQNWLQPDLIELELNHQALLHIVDQYRPTLYKLRDLGVRIAIDNLGLGLVDTPKLLRCPADTLKIDRTVVGALNTDSNAQRLVTQICNIGQRFDLEVIAVGVENSVQEAMLAAAGCEVMQGFMYAEPIPQKDFDAYLSDWHTNHAAAVARD
ncbi:MAG: bifunctional diguanylate cyclase/phosphodiesterase [Pseudomonadota bacterium]